MIDLKTLNTYQSRRLANDAGQKVVTGELAVAMVAELAYYRPHSLLKMLDTCGHHELIQKTAKDSHYIK